MKIVANRFLNFVGRCLSIFAPIVVGFNRMYVGIYSGYVSASFMKIGYNNIFKKCTIYNPQYIQIGNNNVFGKNAVISAWPRENDNNEPKLLIGNYCNFGEYCHVTSANRIVIGDNVLLGRWITITDNSHGKNNYLELDIPPASRSLYSKGEVHICNNVWIGDKATILPGISIGEGSIIGANTVVTQNVPAKSIAVGHPMRIINIK